MSSGRVGTGYMLGDDLAFLEISEDSPMQNKFSDTQIIIKKIKLPGDTTDYKLSFKQHQ